MLKKTKKIIKLLKSKILVVFLQKKIDVIDFTSFDYVIIFENNIGFDTIMKQRPQHIASNFPDNVLFLYHSNRDKYPNFKNIIKLKNNLYLINLDMYRNDLFKKLENFKKKYLMIYSTNFANEKILNKYIKNNFKVIYEYVDEISERLNGKRNYKKLKKIYEYLINKNGINIVCTASKLLDQIKSDNSHAKYKLITNGVFIEDFKNKNNTVPNDIKNIINKQKPIIGYYGVFANWFDYELIRKISDINLYEIILIGIKYDQSFDNSQINKLSNVHYLGKKDYQDLVNYVSNFDVCIIPFTINEVTLSTSPVKLFEYMAAEKPIVTTDMPECRKYKSVLIGKNHNQFLLKIEEALTKKDNLEYKKLLIKEASENTWSNKCKEIIDFIEEN